MITVHGTEKPRTFAKYFTSPRSNVVITRKKIVEQGVAKWIILNDSNAFS